MILTILKFLPELIALIKTLAKMVEEGKDIAEIKAAIKNFDSSLSTAVATKDSSKLEDIFRGKK